MSAAHLNRTAEGHLVMGLDVTSAPLTFSLESLPALLGANQFRTLVTALDLDDAIMREQAFQGERFDRGAFVARAIVSMAKRREDDARRAAEKAFSAEGLL